MGQSNAVLNVSGEILTPEQAKVSVFDRSYLYGDSLYEVIRTYGGRFFGMEDHLRRLEASVKLCRMTLKQSSSELVREMEKTLAAFHKKVGSTTADAYCRIVISRGVGRIGFSLSCLETPSQFTIYLQPLDAPTPEQRKKGMSLKISDRLRNDRRALDPAMKSGNYLNNLLSYLEASEEKYDDAILCNDEGHVTEGTTFNIFYVRRGIVATPPLDIGILEGLTRRNVITVGRAAGIDVREVRFPAERLYEADEVFISSTIKEVFPVNRVDNHVLRKALPGPITQKLQSAFTEFVKKSMK